MDLSINKKCIQTWRNISFNGNGDENMDEDAIIFFAHWVGIWMGMRMGMRM